MLVPGLLERGSHAGLLSVTFLGLLDRSYQVIHSWSLPVLNLEAFEIGHTMNQVRLPPVLGLGQLS